MGAGDGARGGAAGRLADDAVVEALVDGTTEGVTAGGQCRVWVSGRETCHGRVECGRHTVYGRGSSSFPCEVQGAAVRGGEDMVTATDGDAAFRVDSGAGTLTVHDDASGPLGAFSVSARLDPPG